MIRLLVSDIDGTLVRHDKTLSESTIAATRDFTAAGFGMSLISARPISGMQWIVDALRLPGPFGAFNGGTVFGVDGIRGAPKRLPADVARRLLNILVGAGIDVWLFADNRWYARHADNPHVPHERLSAGLEPTLRDDLHALCEAADKIVGISDDAALLARVEVEARAATAGEATVARSQTYFLDATALQANKGDGVAAIAAAMKVPLSEVAVIGDMPNDLPMFARAGLSIAMGQAPESVRQAGTWLTTSNDEDGVAAAIRRLIDERP